MKKLIIFDLDGTLLDTLDDLANSVNFALSKHGFPTHSLESFYYFIGNGLYKLLERAVPEDRRNKQLIDTLKADFIDHYYAHADDLTKPYPGISDMMQQLDADGYQLAIASNKIHQATVDLAAKFFPHINFVAVLGQREDYEVKPHPVILHQIIEIAGLSNNEVLYVGDSGVDAQTAQNADVDFVGVLWGFRPQKELEEMGATVFVEQASDLYSHIRSL